ncbi:MAG: hypothetical protein HY710_06660 [Candidatus Latescibacteria bacterium]|nr:hypothetical protein [Candidatus Latescibacterota bacterium]
MCDAHRSPQSFRPYLFQAWPWRPFPFTPWYFYGFPVGREVRRSIEPGL